MYNCREYLKRDDQILVLRLQNEETRNRMTQDARDRDRALAHSNRNEVSLPEADLDMDDDAGVEDNGGALSGQDALGSKVIVIHPGSQNLRIGLASDALPKSIPMVIARRWKESECEEDGGEPKPKRAKREDGSDTEPEKLFSDEVGCIKRRSLSWQAKLWGLVCESVHSNVRRPQDPHASEQASSSAKLEGACCELQPENPRRDNIRAQ